MTVLENRHVRSARKSHYCDICGGTIGVGDSYSRQRGVYDGDPYTHVAHDLCIAAYYQAARDNDIRLGWEEYPDFDDEVKPVLLRFFAALAPSQVPDPVSGSEK